MSAKKLILFMSPKTQILSNEKAYNNVEVCYSHGRVSDS